MNYYGYEIEMPLNQHTTSSLEYALRETLAPLYDRARYRETERYYWIEKVRE